MRYLIILVLLLQGCALVPHMLAAAPGVRIDTTSEKKKSGVQPESLSFRRHAAMQPKPKVEDECYHYIDPQVKNPGAMKFGCEDYVKKYKGKVQR